ncbi:DUF1772 domain-containing protein [Hymenobacter convexus]|uniref:DUF1772 domain-containing protein n=1 Tax=Hymenobacter sp. CA1UV-4 TaxID=3063782 RepID=UPI0027141D24|nr:DUF1772 domain-containing protein [Hymenobacter sp. CA1UV-4]MDO7853811.1 DUF1772 domain-containing protein [Hymenobacter sp. CA1UV-4]
MSLFSEILLWLFVLDLGVAFGAGLYETRIVLPLWFEPTADGYRVDGAAMLRTDVGRRFWGPAATLPLTLLTLANLALACLAPPLRHDWWLAAALLALAERLSTFAFFIPMALRLQRAPASAATARRAAWWVRLNYGRIFLTLLAWLAALYTLSLPD